jgi:hypothetical protein
MIGTVAAIERDLTTDGFVARYATEEAQDGLPPGEGAFLPCTFWLADNLALQGRQAEAEALFERLLAIRTDLGLISEEYDPGEGRLVGNFPQRSRTSGSSTRPTTWIAASRSPGGTPEPGPRGPPASAGRWPGDPARVARGRLGVGELALDEIEAASQKPGSARSIRRSPSSSGLRAARRQQVEVGRDERPPSS